MDIGEALYNAVAVRPYQCDTGAGAIFDSARVQLQCLCVHKGDETASNHDQQTVCHMLVSRYAQGQTDIYDRGGTYQAISDIFAVIFILHVFDYPRDQERLAEVQG